MEPVTIVLAISALISAVSGYVSYRTSQNAVDNARWTRDTNAVHDWQSSQMETMQMLADHRSFIGEMRFKGQQMAQTSEAFSQNMAFKTAMLEFEIGQREAQLEFDHIQQMADIQFAQLSIQSAFEAEQLDLELLGDEFAEIAGANAVDQFERKRQQMRETAQIRVSQGESGIFGNTALKEIANSQMQASWDQGILGWNFGNKANMQSAKIKKVKATKDSRVNEALSGISRHVAGSMNGAYAGLTV